MRFAGGHRNSRCRSHRARITVQRGRDGGYSLRRKPRYSINGEFQFHRGGLPVRRRVLSSPLTLSVIAREWVRLFTDRGLETGGDWRPCYPQPPGRSKHVETYQHSSARVSQKTAKVTGNNIGSSAFTLSRQATITPRSGSSAWSWIPTRRRVCSSPASAAVNGRAFKGATRRGSGPAAGGTHEPVKPRKAAALKRFPMPHYCRERAAWRLRLSRERSRMISETATFCSADILNSKLSSSSPLGEVGEVGRPATTW
jgi:hypothetical protein